MSERIEGDYVIYRFPHERVRRYMWSYLRSWWRPHSWICDPVACNLQKGPHRHFSWSMLVRGWKRLLLRGSREYRFD